MNRELKEYSLKDTPIKWSNFAFRSLEKRLLLQQNSIAFHHHRRDLTAVKIAQNLLIYDLGSIILAVKRVSSASGGKTAGVDGRTWTTGEDKLNAIKELYRLLKKSRKYRASPVLRVWIEKPNSNEKRPLGIPTIRDRALQKLYSFAIEPIEETRADEYSFGFRPFRSTQLAISRIRHILDKPHAQNYFILECDIEKCFDEISHKSILKRLVIPNNHFVKEWLKAPIAERRSKSKDKKMKQYGRRKETNAKKVARPKSGLKYETLQNKIKSKNNSKGTPQGGVISPLLCNMVLDGLEGVINGINSSKRFKQIQRSQNQQSKLHIVRFADDFVVMGSSLEVLIIAETAISKFLKTRGLNLSKKKTKITSVKEGFDFLGWNIKRQPIDSRKNDLKPIQKSPRYKPVDTVLIIQPSNSNKRKVKQKLNQIYKSSINLPVWMLINKINPILIGWCNYYASSYHSIHTFQGLERYNIKRLCKLMMKKHKKGILWVLKKYLQSNHMDSAIEYKGKYRNNTFVAPYWEKTKKRPWMFEPTLTLRTWIPQHKTGMNVFTEEGRAYWEKRKFMDDEYLTERRRKIYENWDWKCGLCGAHLATDAQANVWFGGSAGMTNLDVELHHYRTPRWAGGTDSPQNIMPVHKQCHPQAQKDTDSRICAKWNLDDAGDNRTEVKRRESSERKEIARMSPLRRRIYLDAKKYW